MANPSKRKGTDFENAVVAYLRQKGWPHAERRALAGKDDRGDVINGPRWFTIECKNANRIDLSGWMDEAAREAENVWQATGYDTWGVVVSKARGKPVERAYVTMDLEDFLAIAKILEGGFT